MVTPEQRRERVRLMFLDGNSRKQITETLGYHMTTIRDDIKKLREVGQLPPPKPTGTHGVKSVTMRNKTAGHSGGTSNRAEQAILRAKAFEMRSQGYKLREIAAELDRDVRAVSNWIDAEIKALIIPQVEHYRALQLATMEQYLVYLQPKLKKGDDKAINAAIRISERISKFCGLDTPVRLDVTHHELDKADAELAEMITESKAKQAVEEQHLRDEADADRRAGS